MTAPRKAAASAESPRPWKTAYAGAPGGSAKTAEGALTAACRHMLRDGYTKCTITHESSGRTGWVRRTPFGFTVHWAWLPPKWRPRLRRVK